MVLLGCCARRDARGVMQEQAALHQGEAKDVACAVPAAEAGNARPKAADDAAEHAGHHGPLIAAQGDAGAERACGQVPDSRDLGGDSESLLVPNASGVFSALAAQHLDAPSAARTSTDGTYATARATLESTWRASSEATGDIQPAQAAPSWTVDVHDHSQTSVAGSMDGTCDVLVASICGTASNGSFATAAGAGTGVNGTETPAELSSAHSVGARSRDGSRAQVRASVRCLCAFKPCLRPDKSIRATTPPLCRRLSKRQA